MAHPPAMTAACRNFGVLCFVVARAVNVAYVSNNSANAFSVMAAAATERSRARCLAAFGPSHPLIGGAAASTVSGEMEAAVARTKPPRFSAIYNSSGARGAFSSAPSSTVAAPTRIFPTLHSGGGGGGEDETESAPPRLRRSDKIQVEVVRFGRLGATVDVIGLGHREEDCIAEGEAPLGRGLIVQREIWYFREARGGLDVVRGEVLPAYVEDNSREDGRLNVSLRAPGGKAKAADLAKVIQDKLEWDEGGMVGVGDKSTPAEIRREFPGVSKGQFKKAVGSLYKRGLIEPGPYSIKLVKAEEWRRKEES